MVDDLLRHIASQAQQGFVLPAASPYTALNSGMLGGLGMGGGTEGAKVYEGGANPLQVYRAGDAKPYVGNTTFYSEKPEGASPFGEARPYTLNLAPEDIFDASKGSRSDPNSHSGLYEQFLKDTGHPGGRGRNALPYWTTENELKGWLKQKGLNFKAIRFDEPTGIPSIGVLGSDNLK